ncbi:hypothetical protein ACTNEN_09710 [Oribacterium sp. HCP28S3_H8]|uniref:hypothetical protein n=1 Tax=Oribacterium sp. HCP28S3_H8 TaxID=3438945 RepID=UPI003F8BA20F
MKCRGTIKSVNPHDIRIDMAGDLANIERYVGKDLDIELKIHRKHRSLNANAMLWACLTDLAAALHVDNWTMYETEIKRYGVGTEVAVIPAAVPMLKSKFRVVVDLGARDGMAHELCYFGSSTYNSKEMSRLIDGVLQDMREMNLETPDDEIIDALIKELESGNKAD